MTTTGTTVPATARVELEEVIAPAAGAPARVRIAPTGTAYRIELVLDGDAGALAGRVGKRISGTVRGRALRNVIITRLPFEVPDRPIVQARHELIESRGGRPFFEDSLPRAVLRFKQGFGRLVRSSTDEGRVVVLDPRIATKRYGRAFLDALPEGVVPEFEED